MCIDGLWWLLDGGHYPPSELLVAKPRKSRIKQDSFNTWGYAARVKHNLQGSSQSFGLRITEFLHWDVYCGQLRYASPLPSAGRMALSWKIQLLLHLYSKLITEQFWIHQVYSSFLFHLLDFISCCLFLFFLRIDLYYLLFSTSQSLVAHVWKVFVCMVVFNL